MPRCFLQLADYSKYNLQPPPKESIIAANQKPLNCIGTLTTTMNYGNRAAKDTVYICEEATGVLLAWFTCVTLGIIPKDYPSPMKCQKVQTGPPPSVTIQDDPVTQ